MPASSYRFDRYVVEPHTARLLEDGEVVALEPKAFSVLLFLLEHRDRLVGKQELLDAVWPDVVVTENALTRAMARLRKALGDNPRTPRYIATIHSRGYRFLAPVELRQQVSPQRPDAGSPEAVPAEAAPPAAGSRLLKLGVVVAAGVLLVAVVGRLGVDPGRPPAATAEEALDPRRIAVLPMVDLSGLTDGEHVADGLTEQMISVLSRIDGVRTVPRTSVMAYKGSPRRVSEIGRELGAGTALEGSLSRDRDQLRITFRLVDVVHEESLWSKEFNCSLIDFFAVQSEVTMRLGELLHAHVSSDQLRAIARGPTQEVTAFEHYLRGRGFYRQITRIDNEKAIEHYRRALELDPDFALAQAALANALGSRVVRFGFDAEEDSGPALAAARRALELEADLPEAFLAIGLVEFGRSRIRSALEHILKALELNPDYDEALFYASYSTYELGQLDESLLFGLRDRSPSPERRSDHAFRLWELGFEESALAIADHMLKKDPLLLKLGIYLAGREMLEGELDTARARVERLSQAYPHSAWLWRTAGEIESRAGRSNEALAHFERAAKGGGGDDLLELRTAMIRWQRGQQAAAAPTLDRMAAGARQKIERGSEWSQDPWTLAAVAAIRGNADEAVLWYEKAVDAGHRAFYWDEGDPLFAPVRDDPRFVAQLGRMRSDVAAMRERVVRELGPDLNRALRHLMTTPP